MSEQTPPTEYINMGMGKVENFMSCEAINDMQTVIDKQRNIKFLEVMRYSLKERTIEILKELED